MVLVRRGGDVLPVSRVARIVTVVTLIAASMVAGLSTVAPTISAAALSGSDFSPGYIISDANFYDYGSLSASGIQTFLNGQVTNCAPVGGVPCLKNYTETTASRDAVSGRCAAYTGASNELASTIIYKVAQACQISPKVILVLLQKEEGLVTATSPSSSRYTIATGYGCPDTASCDTQYYGFYNQVYRAALQFRTYSATASSWNYRVGNVAIQYSPNASCGSSVVNIQNQATADLYIYTPYQPNQAALNNLSGTGDGCSSYGNRNFWVYYSNWFGSPTGNSNPFGVIDTLGGNPAGITIAGWAIDPDTAGPISVRVFVDGTDMLDQVANVSLPKLTASFPDKGPNHGYAGTIAGTFTGNHVVCVTLVNTSFGSDNQLPCRSVTIPSGSPLGVIDSLTAVPGAVTVTGWMLDPDTVSADQVRITVDGQTAQTVTASGVKAGLDAAFPGYGDNHLYSAVVSGLTGATHNVCVQGLNIGAGSDGSAICRTIIMPSGGPIGVIDATTVLPNTATVSGWMLDPDSTGPIQVKVLIDGALKSTVTANGVKTGLDAAFPGYGDNHLYTASISSLVGGPHQLCVIGVNVGGGKDSGQICSSISIPTGSPLGVIDTTYAWPGNITVSGWMLDPDTIDPITARITVDGQASTSVTANATKSGLNSAFPGYGDQHGFTATATGLAGGRHTICVVGVNFGPGSDGGPCQVVTMPTGSPLGVIDSATTEPGTIIVSGWMLDPDVTTAIQVKVVVNGQLAGTVTAGGTKTDLSKSFPGYGDLHLYTATVTGAWTGTNQLCIIGVNVGGGSDSTGPCSSVTMPTGSPLGVIDSLTAGAGSLTVTGWALDPDVATPINVEVRVDGVSKGLFLADKTKTGLGTTFPGYGDNHLYQTVISGLASGSHEVCVYLPNVGLPSSDGYAGCATTTVP